MNRRVMLLLALTSLLAVPAAAQHNLRDRAMGAYRDGLAHMRAEAFDQAEKAFASAVALDPSFEMAYYMLGRAQMPQKRFVHAVASFTRARDLYLSAGGRRFSNAQEAQRYRSDRMMEMDEAIRQLQSGPQTQQTQLQIRQLEDRRRLLQENIRRGGDVTIASQIPAYVSLSLGSAYYRAGATSQAEQAWLEAIETDPRAGEAHSNLAVVYLETGRYAEAERALRAAEKAGLTVASGLRDEILKKVREGRH